MTALLSYSKRGVGQQCTYPRPCPELGRTEPELGTCYGCLITDQGQQSAGGDTKRLRAGMAETTS